MNSLTQYLSLFKEHRSLIDSHSSPIMNALREDAFLQLEQKGLPQKGAENYETTDLNSVLATDFGLNLSRININVNTSEPYRCGVPDISPDLCFFLNDLFYRDCKKNEDLQEGVYIGSLKNFCKKYPEEALKFYGKCADIQNPLTALNTIFAQDGMVVRLKKGIKLDKPLQLISLFDSGAPLMAIRRLLIILEEDASLQLLSCDHTQRAGMDFLNLQTTEIFVGNNSTLDFYELEESTPSTSRLSTLYLNQGKDSRVTIDGITLYNGKTRNEYYCKFCGPDAELKLFGMGILDLNRHLDTYSRIEHEYPGCHTDEMFKYVLDGEATGAFAGLIKVLEGADKTEAYQTNRNIVGSDEASMFSKPQLEIYDDDVKCSHGSATGQIDFQHIFYMQTRGIPEETARFLLKQAFMADIIDAVNITGLKDRLKLLVERRFAGGELGCAVTCGKGCL